MINSSLNPHISVVTVVYNGFNSIEKTIRSVLEQTVFSDVEYILIEGGSTDETMDIIRKYVDQIDILVSEKDRGIYDAMNKAIRLAHGRWICFMNAGDTFYSNYTLESLHLDSIEADKIIYGDCVLVTEKGNITKKAHPFFNEKSELKGIGICHQAIYTPTQWLKCRPFKGEQFHYCADFEFLYYCWEQGYHFEYRPQPLCYYEYGNGVSSTQRHYRNILIENATIIKKKRSWAYYKEMVKSYF